MCNILTIISQLKKAEASKKMLFIQILENIHMWNKMYTYQMKTSLLSLNSGSLV